MTSYLPTIRLPQVNQRRKNYIRYEFNMFNGVLRLFSASSSQWTALLTPVSYPPYSDPIPTRSTHAMCSEMTASRYGAETRARVKKKTYVAVGSFANELILELGARRQVHRCTPYRRISRIQRDLSAIFSDHCRQNTNAHTYGVGCIPATKLRHVAHHKDFLSCEFTVNRGARRNRRSND
jgi:hypothetical protein